MGVLPERALWWPARRTVFVADVHLGKGATFAAAGIPVPMGATQADLDDLGAVLDRMEAVRLVILGDLLHARSAREANTLGVFARWRAQRRGVEMVLVRGNHDLHAGDPPEDWGMACQDEGEREGPFVLSHVPPEAHGVAGHVLCGHVHPVLRLAGPGGSAERCACLIVGAGRTILPAFGRFTGGKAQALSAGERVFVFGTREVVEVRASAAGYAAGARGRGRSRR